MPELPEVETVRRGLAELLPGQVIIDVQSTDPKVFPNSPLAVKNHLIGATISQVRRRAKLLIIELDNQYSLLVHLKMTGQLVFRANDGQRFGAGHPSPSLIGQLPDKSTRVTLFLTNAKLFFNDQRRFGWMRLLPTVEVPETSLYKKLGPEPLAANFTAANFRRQMGRRPRSTIKAVLLDQTVIAGIGNIYADESLYAAKIHPAQRVGDISVAKLNNLYKVLRAILNLSLAKGGSTDRNYVDAHGRRGSYLDFAEVFRREGQPCLRCGQTIVKLRVAGRGTHICPHCQKPPKAQK